jgi:hypothetical protein
MNALWIVFFGLLATVPVLVTLLTRVVKTARGIARTVGAIDAVAAAASKDLDAVIQLATTQSYVSQTVAGLANYGGSLDVALPNA